MVSLFILTVNFMEIFACKLQRSILGELKIFMRYFMQSQS